MSKDVRCKMGDWVAVPLRDTGFSIGLVARGSSGTKSLIGYFFGPKRTVIPSAEDTRSLSQNDAVLICRFNYSGIAIGRWPIIYRSTDWDRSPWPNPIFVAHSPGLKPELRQYSEDDPKVLIFHKYCNEAEAENYPADQCRGYLNMEECLSDLLEEVS